MNRLQHSGYDERKRCKILKKALKKKEKEKDVEGNGQRSVVFEDGKNETVIFIYSTPGEVLKKKIEIISRKDKMEMKAVEERGRTVNSMRQKSYPFQNKCGKADCVICKKKQKHERSQTAIPNLALGSKYA